MELAYQHIVIEGCIGAGKTTLSNLMAETLDARLLLEQFSENPFLPMFYEHPERYAFPVELFFMSDRHKQIQAHFSKPELFQQSTIADYMFTKSLLFAGHTLPPDELRLFQHLFQILSQQLPKPDALIYLHRPVEALLANISKRGRTYEQNISADYLDEVTQSYMSYFKTVESFPVWIVDATNWDFVDKPQAVGRIIDLLSERHKPGVHYLHYI